jgi:hypothetical protein
MRGSYRRTGREQAEGHPERAEGTEGDGWEQVLVAEVPKGDQDLYDAAEHPRGCYRGFQGRAADLAGVDPAEQECGAGECSERE